MICCIIGKGSIGRRHSKILQELNINSFFIRRKPNKKINNEINYKNNIIKNADFFIVANPSSLHLKTIKQILKFKKPILVEKPFITQEKIGKKLLQKNKIFVLYQMRFDPRINFIKKNIKEEKKIIAKFQWHTFLPNWHKNENYKNSYAANKHLGGGAIFTMSHEIDMATYLLGKVNKVEVKKSKNNLKINVEDNAKIILRHEKGHLSYIDLNFAKKKLVRKFEVQTLYKDYQWDFYSKFILVNNKKIKFNFENDDIYKIQMKNLICNMTKKNYKLSVLHLNNILHTHKILNACINSLQKKKSVKLDK
jgi:predicted dehydrogenase